MVTVYCMNFTMFWCATLKLFSFIIVPLLALNSSDATAVCLSVCLLERQYERHNNELKLHSLMTILTVFTARHDASLRARLCHGRLSVRPSLTLRSVHIGCRITL